MTAMYRDAEDRLSNEIDEAVRRVREVQRKRLAVSFLAFGVAAAIIVSGEALVVWMVGNTSSGSIPVLIFALPFAAGLPPAWLIRTALWPKDPAI
jgi:hypothetical protein